VACALRLPSDAEHGAPNPNAPSPSSLHSLSLSFAPALELQQVFCFFLPPARNPKGYNLQDATGRFLNSYKNPKKDNLEPHPDSVLFWVRNFAKIRKIKIIWRIFCRNIPFFFLEKNLPNFPQNF
jgi:hypothetical protein